MDEANLLAMAERHVEEGRRRIARQTDLIAQLAREGHDALLPEARRLLAEMQKIQAQFEQDLLVRREAAERLSRNTPTV